MKNMAIIKNFSQKSLINNFPTKCSLTRHGIPPPYCTFNIQKIF
ncbi:MAG: hypothetical protein BAJALOKI1v1_40031 [Promethearchaeota archaeon]|nr:MAG: hypothetical protein BAJALOKI1v1_40031 [Candidatus Lokiarchaeota archaeon]